MQNGITLSEFSKLQIAYVKVVFYSVSWVDLVIPNDLSGQERSVPGNSDLMIIDELRLGSLLLVFGGHGQFLDDDGMVVI